MSKRKLQVYVVYSFGDDTGDARIIKVCGSEKLAKDVLSHYRKNYITGIYGATILKFPVAGVENIHHGKSIDVIKTFRG